MHQFQVLLQCPIGIYVGRTLASLCGREAWVPLETAGKGEQATLARRPLKLLLLEGSSAHFGWV